MNNDIKLYIDEQLKKQKQEILEELNNEFKL